MKIKKIKKLSNNKYKIEFVEGESITTYDNVILENNILLKKEIDIETYKKLFDQNTYYEIYNKAVKYIVTKLRSEKEIKEYLKKYTDDKNITEKIINQLKKENLLNDERYIRSFIADKINLTTWGPYKITKELSKLDMDEEIVDNILSLYDFKIFEEKIKKIIIKKQKLNKKDSLYMLKQKIERDLFDLGYPKDMIVDNLSLISLDENDILKKEYEKLYRKLSIKYHDQELYHQIKNKLISKGFSISSINETLENIDK